MLQNNSKIIFTLLSFSFIATLITQIRPELIINFWMSKYYFVQWNYIQTFIQFFTSQFIHWDFFHLIFNAIFIYIFWNYVSRIIWNKILTLFFIFSSIFIWISLIIFSFGITVWMSWFALALLSFYGLELFRLKNIEYKWAVFAIILNIIIWLAPWISLLWHLFWAISGILFFILLKIFNLISTKNID